MKAVFLLASVLGTAAAQTPALDEIMRRVAFNQAKSQDARRQFAYRQKKDVRVRRLNGKLAHEEHREYSVTPEPRGVHKKLTAFDGRDERNGHSVSFERSNQDDEKVGIDGAIADGFGDEMTDHSDSRDDIANDLFPLTYHQQLKYAFRFVDTETFGGRTVYCVAFEPKRDAIWKGEALIDAAEFQPVSVYTKMARSLPLPVRVLLGTNVRGLGFSVFYRKFDDGIWFPVSYGGEFELRALFFYKRTITVALANFDFQRANVNSTVTYSANQP